MTRELTEVEKMIIKKTCDTAGSALYAVQSLIEKWADTESDFSDGQSKIISLHAGACISINKLRR